MRTANSLLYGKRPSGPGPSKPVDVTETFFHCLLTEGLLSKIRNAQEVVSTREEKTIADLVEEIGEEKANEIIRAVMFDKDDADLVEPMSPRRRKIDDRWAITVGAYWEEPYFEAVIKSVYQHQAHLLGEVSFIKIERIYIDDEYGEHDVPYGNSKICNLENLMIEGWHHNCLVLYDFICQTVDVFAEQTKTG